MMHLQSSFRLCNKLVIDDYATDKIINNQNKLLIVGISIRVTILLGMFTDNVLLQCSCPHNKILKMFEKYMQSELLSGLCIDVVQIRFKGLQLIHLIEKIRIILDILNDVNSPGFPSIKFRATRKDIRNK